MNFKATVRKKTIGYTKEGKKLISATINSKELTKLIGKEVEVKIKECD